MYWESLRKTTTIVLVQREYTTAKVFAENIRIRVDDDAPMVDLSVDLNKSLRSRSKGVSSYVDAKHLAEDRLSDFKSLTIDDHGIIDHINNIVKHVDFEVPSVWRLHVALQGDYWFNARPEYKKVHAYESLTFRVESALDQHPRA